MPTGAASLVAFLLMLAVSVSTASTANSKLQLHFMDVGQGDGALLISPQGQTVLFDNGALGYCGRPLEYLRRLGISKIDYQVVSHYHADHIGCTAEVLGVFPLVNYSFDRGGEYKSGVFSRYLLTVGEKRRTALTGEVLVLDSSSSNPVYIYFVALNGNGIKTTNENDLSLLTLIKHGDFEAVIGGDLSGYSGGGYADIETSVGPYVGPVEVYKVHHHCSRYSTNPVWLTTITPRVAIISAGVGNGYGHPTDECLSRLHSFGTRTYWTSVGRGAIPQYGADVVAQGSVVMEVGTNAKSFSLGPAEGVRDEYSVLEGSAQPRPKTSVSGREH
jgi:beta-lactamase superfamily II metal-dependent hydrolase